jgi:hypothetical protein
MDDREHRMGYALILPYRANPAGWNFREAHLAKPHAFACHVDELRRLNWVVFAKPPFGGPEQVLAYLGRPTHRVTIAKPSAGLNSTPGDYDSDVISVPSGLYPCGQAKSIYAERNPYCSVLVDHAGVQRRSAYR